MKHEIIYLPIGKLKPNPDNPRLIRDANFKRLVKSLKDCPQLFDARPCICSDRTGDLIVLGGNMRLMAAKELKYSEVPVIVMSGLTPDQEREIVIKDNGENFGEWDFDLLANWSDEPLKDWGVDLPEDWLKGDEEIEQQGLNKDNMELLNSFSVYHPAINKVRSCRFLSVRRFANDNKNAINTIKDIKKNIDVEIIKAIADETADFIKSIFGNFIDVNSICTAVPRGHSIDNDYYFAGSIADRIADRLGFASCKLFKDNIKKTKNIHNYNEKKASLIDDVRGKNIIVFDDIATTGTTMENCCNALREYNFIIPVVWIYENIAIQDKED